MLKKREVVRIPIPTTRQKEYGECYLEITLLSPHTPGNSLRCIQR